MKSLLLIVSLFSLSACLSGGGGPEVNINTGGGANNPAAAAVTTANTKLKSVADMIDGNAAASLPFAGKTFGGRAALSTGWTTPNGVPDLSNNGSSTLQAWMSNQFDETFQNSNGAKVTFAGRVSNTLDIFCYMANSSLSLDSNGLPTAGTYELTLSASVNQACGGGVSDDTIGATIGLTVTDVQGSALYDRSLSFSLPGSENCPFQFMAKVEGDSFNIATSEDQNCDGRNQASQSVFTYDAATQVSRFFYISQDFDGNGNTGFEMYRGYLNEATDEAYVVGQNGEDSNGAAAGLRGVTFVAVGKPDAGGSVAVSIQTAGQTLADGFYQACVDPGDLSIETDDTVACTIQGDDASDAFVNLIQAAYSSNTTLTDVSTINATTSVGFTDNTDIFTF